MASRKDNRGRVLQKGEVHRSDCRYHFAYTDVSGKRRFMYADTLAELREKERLFYIADWQGATQAGSMVTLDYMYDRSLSMSYGGMKDIAVFKVSAKSSIQSSRCIFG